jgi:hypothetical protein
LIYYFLVEVAEAMIADGSRHRSFEPLTVDGAEEQNAVGSPATIRSWLLSTDSALAMLPERVLRNWVARENPVTFDFDCLGVSTAEEGVIMTSLW